MMVHHLIINLVMHLSKPCYIITAVDMLMQNFRWHIQLYLETMLAG